jgi:hypothetical protein
MANNPFLPPKFPPGPPTTEKGVWEDGPGAYASPVSPPNSGLPVYYNGTTQTSIMNVSYVKPPRQTTPSAGDKNHSKIQ